MVWVGNDLKERTLKLVPAPLSWTRTSSTRSCCTKSHPTRPRTLPEMGHSRLPGWPVPVPHYPRYTYWSNDNSNPSFNKTDTPPSHKEGEHHPFIQKTKSTFKVVASHENVWLACLTTVFYSPLKELVVAVARNKMYKRVRCSVSTLACLFCCHYRARQFVIFRWLQTQLLRIVQIYDHIFAILKSTSSFWESSVKYISVYNSDES